jgi:ribosomal-protein-alanine N-acetyltransferase
MSHGDVPEVLAIENESFSTPWSATSFMYELTNPFSTLEVVVLNNRIIGYICTRIIAEEAHILNLAVHPEFRRRGIASKLIWNALKKLRLSAVNLVTLEVRASNTAAIKLYEKFGFEVIGNRKDYYQKPMEDAIVMGLEFRG